MRLILPKASRGYVFDRLATFEMNDFDVERLLPSLFHVVVTRGHQRGGRVNDPSAVDRYLDALANHARVKGFDGEVGHRLLDRWVRASIVRIGRSGRGRSGQEQVEYVLPLTILAYKPGLPAEIARQRKVHLFLYRVLLEVLYDVDAAPSPQAALSAIFTDAFGKGVVIGAAPKYDGSYDGRAELDLHNLLTICYLDGFAPTEASKRERIVEFGPALPGVAEGIGRDLPRYILAYVDRVPTLALTRGLMALINFGLFAYTIKLMYATNYLVTNREWAPARHAHDFSDPELYVDFTRVRGGGSDALARACVERDLEELRAFFESSMRLRTLDRFVELQRDLKARLEGLNTPTYLEALIGLSGESGIEARAQAEIESIRHETINSCVSEEERKEAQDYFEDILRRTQGSSLDAAVQLLSDAQRKKAVESYVAWFWSTGGLRKSFGVLAGNLRGRRNWRYAMSDDLLATLVQLALTEDPSGRLQQVSVRPRLAISEFLQFLYRRFGILVDRPPTFLDGSSARRAGKENLEGLKRRLHQMGFFEALSDDFTAQYLRDPAIAEAVS
ncbi:MAG: methylation-associated defense system protein MAD7 [Gammaproteobacteria bacterium]